MLMTTMPLPKMPERALYPGTFDPLTYGHLDIVTRASRMFAHLVVAVAPSAGKSPLLTLQDRLALAEADLRPLAAANHAIQIVPLEGLLIETARRHGAHCIVRGLRDSADFAEEARLAGMNRTLAPDIETLFLVADARYGAMSSTLVRQIAHAGGDLAAFVPPASRARLRALQEGVTTPPPR